MTHQSLLFPRPGVELERCSTWAPDLVAALRRHYSGSAGAPPGKKLAWRVLEDGQLVGWVGLGEPTFRLGVRRRLTVDGVTPALPDGLPAPRTVSCFLARFEGHRAPASAILRAWQQRASHDWAEAYGWVPDHWETLVGPPRKGLCFRRIGYRPLGLTTGRTARRPAGHGHGKRVWGDGEPKLVLYRGPFKRLPARHPT